MATIKRSKMEQDDRDNPRTNNDRKRQRGKTGIQGRSTKRVNQGRPRAGLGLEAVFWGGRYGYVTIGPPDEYVWGCHGSEWLVGLLFKVL